MSQHSNRSPFSALARVSHRLALGAVALLTLGLTCVWAGGSPPIAHAATVAINQCNYVETGAARELICTVNIVNYIDVVEGTTVSKVSTTVCAGAPGEAGCVTTPGTLTTDLVGSVNQCNNSVNAGGSIVTCTVNIVNNISGTGLTSPATVNQCIGSGQGGGTEPTMICAPSAASGADIIQCNTAGNGGGATERVQCSTLTSTVSSLLPVTIVQCNDSANGGGDLVTCRAQITTTFVGDLTPEEIPSFGAASRGLILLAVLVTGVGAVSLLAARRRRFS